LAFSRPSQASRASLAPSARAHAALRLLKRPIQADLLANGRLLRVKRPVSQAAKFRCSGGAQHSTLVSTCQVSNCKL